MSGRVVMMRGWLGVVFVTLASLGMWFAWPSRAAEEDEPKKVALLVGVNRSEMRIFADHPLRFAERDVKELAAVFREQGFTVRTLTGADARKDDIDAALTAVLKGRTAKDIVVIGFAGHGVQMPLEDEPGKPGRELSDAYFCPVDAVFGKGSTMISLTRLVERLEVEGGINLLLVDACRDNPDLHRGATRSLSGNELIGRLPRNSAILFSCSKGQQALEHEKAGGGHGVFFHHVIEGLRGAAADPETGEVGWDELVAHVRKRVNPTARALDPVGARKADELFGGQLQTPHQLTNLVATPVLARRSILLEGTRPGQEREDNGLKLKFCWCPRGTFRMGSPKDEPGRFNNEGDENGPVSVTLSRGFWTGKFEATQGQWQAVMGTTIRDQRDKADPKYSLYGEGPDHPMYYVNHDEASEFCFRFTESERRAGRLPAGWEYHLPTEAQWEYACRAETSTRYNFGDDEASLGEYAWFEGNSSASTHPIGQKSPNRCGLCDVHGNVWEWCADWYNAKLVGGLDPRGASPGRASDRVYRGGGCYFVPRYARSADRGGSAPGNRSNVLGFRLALVQSSR